MVVKLLDKGTAAVVNLETGFKVHLTRKYVFGEKTVDYYCCSNEQDRVTLSSQSSSESRVTSNFHRTKNCLQSGLF